MNDQPKHDPTIWREIYNSVASGDYYGHSISISEEGAVKMAAGGYVVIKPDVRAWVATAMDES